MGWKSTITLTRREAITAIRQCLETYETKSNFELEEIMYDLGIGDDPNKPYFGHNFEIVDNDESKKYINDNNEY